MKAARNGFTLLEVTVAGALLVLTLFLGMSVFRQVKTQEQEGNDRIDAKIDTWTAENLMNLDLRNLDPSFNNLDLKDDQGKGFFDYYDDVPASHISDPKRTLTLKIGGTRKEFFFIQGGTSEGQILIYDPVKAYQVGNPPTDFNLSAPLSFESLNRDSAVSSKQPDFWVDGAYLMLDTPVKIRPIGVDMSVDLLIPARSPAFLGQVQGQDFKRASGLPFNFTHPTRQTPITNVDDFLRGIPSMAGGQNFVRVRRANIIRYYLEPQTDRATGQALLARLYRQVLTANPRTDQQPFLVADGVDSVQFERDSVTNKVIKYLITKVE